MNYRRESIELPIPELPVRAVVKHSLVENVTADAHLHSEIELIRVLEGEMTVHFKNQSKLLKKGELIFINSMVVHSTAIPEQSSTKIFVLQFNPTTLYNQPIFSKHRYLLSFINQDACNFNLLSVDSNPMHNEIADLTEKVISEFELHEIAFEISIKSYLYRILSLLYRSQILHLSMPMLTGDNTDVYTKLEPIIAYTEAHYMDNISVEDISAMAHFNYSYFCRLFKKATGKSYIDFLNYVRISVADELLRTTDLPISLILEKTGFTSLSYFNRVFKNLNGLSPSAYRKQMCSNPLST